MQDMKFAKKTIGLLLTVIMISGLFGNMMIEAKTQDAKATSITFKTSTGGDFVTGVCKMKITFRLNAAAKNVQLNIINSDEEVVFTKTFKSCKKKKAYTLTWDGKNKKKKYVGEDFYNVEIKVGKTSTNSMDLDVANGAFKLIRKSGFAGGDGSEKKPYEVKSLDQLKKVEEHNGQFFVQTADIDIDYADFKGMFSEANMFIGSYDGSDHAISNGIFTEGLFHFVGEGGEIKNLTITGCSSDGHYTGALTRANHGTIKKCKVSSCNLTQGSFGKNSGALGGITGTNYSKITNCEVTGLNAMDTWKDTVAGGICGENQGNIIQCTVKDSEISATGEEWGNRLGHAGGLAGLNSGNVTNCSVTETNVNSYKIEAAGLFVGVNEGVVSGCSPKSSDKRLIGSGNDAV